MKQATITLKQAAGLPGANAIPSVSEAGILGIASLTAWWDAEHEVSAYGGLRWRDKASTKFMTQLGLYAAIRKQVSGSWVLQMGYGLDDFAGVDRGAMRPNSEHALINPTIGFKVISVIRCPLAGSGESAVSGGQVWGSVGPADGTTPGLRISESTGRPLLRAGGVSITANPPDIDLRDGAFHIIRCALDVASMRLRINVDKGRASQVAVLTAPLPVVDPAVPNSLAPILGLQLTSAGVGTFPCYGQHASHLYFNSGALSVSELSAVENYLAARYGVVLV